MRFRLSIALFSHCETVVRMIMKDSLKLFATQRGHNFIHARVSFISSQSNKLFSVRLSFKGDILEVKNSGKMPHDSGICATVSGIVLAIMFGAVVSASSKYIILNLPGFGEWQITSFQLVELSIGQITNTNTNYQ